MKRRNPLVVMLLTLVTLGIYFIYWLYKTRKEMAQAVNDPKAIHPVILLFAPWLLVFALFLLEAAISAITQNGDSSAGLLIALPIILLCIAGSVYPFFWFYKYSETVHRLVPETDTAQTYVLWVVLFLFSVGFVWPLIVQTELNKYIDRQAGNGPMPSQPQYPSAMPAQQPYEQEHANHQATPAPHATHHHLSHQAPARPHHHDEPTQLPPSPVQGQ